MYGAIYEELIEQGYLRVALTDFNVVFILTFSSDIFEKLFGIETAVLDVFIEKQDPGTGVIAIEAFRSA